MLKPAFSTVACPDWTLAMVAQKAAQLGFEAVELRTFGDASGQFACDPALSSEEKTRRAFHERGIEILCLGTSARFDAPVWPPVIGLFSNQLERSVREAQRAIDLAVRLECPFVRVFGYEYPSREASKVALKRIGERIWKVCDHADKTGVRVLLENGGSFSSAARMMELIDKVNHPLLGASYSLSTGVSAGDDPAQAARLLGDRLFVARILDAKAGQPVLLGTGDLPCESFTKELVRVGFDGPLVYQWDRAWLMGLAPAEEALGHAAKTMFRWLTEAQAGRGAGTQRLVKA
jgi:sugar phosphate isomerase/epimerase